jgi:hypothetical protein
MLHTIPKGKRKKRVAVKSLATVKNIPKNPLRFADANNPDGIPLIVRMRVVAKLQGLIRIAVYA